MLPPSQILATRSNGRRDLRAIARIGAAVCFITTTTAAQPASARDALPQSGAPPSLSADRDAETRRISDELQTLRQQWRHTPRDEVRSILQREIDTRERWFAEIARSAPKAESNKSSLQSAPGHNAAPFCVAFILAAGALKLFRLRYRRGKRRSY